MKQKAFFIGVYEMERRYRYMMDLNVRNIQCTNKQIQKNEEDGRRSIYSPTEGNNEKYLKITYIVVVVDEFADMMQTVGKKVEDLIIRLSQKSESSRYSFNSCLPKICECNNRTHKGKYTNSFRSKSILKY